ncbi:MAG TPA: glycoside hydrolase family 15 protein [Trueperaceae bacterium]|nr:glycoside hydrolase family 15 protein [Trueperaceae bacterium]
MSTVHPVPLARRSLAVLLEGQSRSGAFVASPAFPVYGYAWLRDGAFCAHALDVAGETGAARAFHGWVARTVQAHRALFEDAIARVDAGGPAAGGAERVPPRMPPARYTLQGTLERGEGAAAASGDDGGASPDEPWPNFQIDGYGMWLWALAEHLHGAPLPDALRPAVSLVARYLERAWPLRCFDCWEEWGGGEHASTLGAAAAGLDAAAGLLGDGRWQRAADGARARLLERFAAGGRLRRGAEDDRVDGSMLWLGVPFGALAPRDPRMRATVETIRTDLAGPGGGLYRYRGDTYYGGGQWLLLTSSLAWHDAQTGAREAAIEAQAWVRAQATPDGELPEQVTHHPQDAAMVAPWQDRWGPVATPLLWSHAMYLIAEAAVR